MERDAFAVARHGDITAVAIHAGRSQHMGSIDGHALRLVDRRRIAVIESAIVLDIECDRAPVVGAHRHALSLDALDRSERAVLHLKTALVAQEHDAVAGSNITLGALDCPANTLAQIAPRTRKHPRLNY